VSTAALDGMYMAWGSSEDIVDLLLQVIPPFGAADAGGGGEGEDDLMVQLMYNSFEYSVIV